MQIYGAEAIHQGAQRRPSKHTARTNIFQEISKRLCITTTLSDWFWQVLQVLQSQCYLLFAPLVLVNILHGLVYVSMACIAQLWWC